MKIKDMFPDERPREKLRLRGARSLSNADLLAILIGSGTGGKSAVDVAQDIIKACEGRLALLGAMPLEKLIALKGMGEVRGIVITAALELGRRAFEENAIQDRKAITTPEQVYRIMLPTMKNLDHEECWALYLNRSSLLLGKEMICSGSLEAVTLDVGRILKKAIEKQCTHVILVHNHPDGSCRPSQGDIAQTDRLRKALGAVEISLLDHIVIGENDFFSFSEDTRQILSP